MTWNRRQMLIRSGQVVLGTAAVAVTGGASGAIGAALASPAQRRWSTGQAWAWYNRQPWMTGCNYTPATASNQIEMFRRQTFDAPQIAKELRWASRLEMNTIRVFAHDLLWLHDRRGFVDRFNRLLDIANSHGIRVMPVLFDSCWDPYPKWGPQPAPIPNVHNSRWLQSPGAPVLADYRPHLRRLEDYTTGFIDEFKQDERVVMWDIWNEPDQITNVNVTGLLPNKLDSVAGLLPKTFVWARNAQPTQPLTSALFHGTRANPLQTFTSHRTPIPTIQLENSDVITFHNYDPPDVFTAEIGRLERYRRPLVCTEYLARRQNNKIETILPIMAARGIGAINWGLVAGKTQTNEPWDSWVIPKALRQNQPWFHDLLLPDGRPYRRSEESALRKYAAQKR